MALHQKVTNERSGVPGVLIVCVHYVGVCCIIDGSRERTTGRHCVYAALMFSVSAFQ
ncbi:Uncharacterized protein DAT39_004305 [Clarias magur]|uniref:Uncharacterized protein n=1 Tax=Clarias magur TaxID=1594786 RepID=A0A8J4XEH4_CLAMG|nr:Uncharacterized protein DAT39_004305 [Clarias magur]